MSLKLIDIKELSTKQKFILCCILLLLLILISNVISGLGDSKAIDYKNATSLTFLISSVEENDRNTYWILNDIITDYIISYQYDNSIGMSYKDYYDALTPEYKKYLGSGKYNSLSKRFLEKFKVTSSTEETMKTFDVIDTVYKDLNDQNRYICKLKTSKEDTEAYIGIILNVKNNTYNIFYIE